MITTISTIIAFARTSMSWIIFGYLPTHLPTRKAGRLDPIEAFAQDSMLH